MNMHANYHTHTFRCKHAAGDVDDYCEMALVEGLKVIGISDHTPFPDNRWLAIRMNILELDEYSKSVEIARKKFAQRGLKVYKGLECEYCPEFDSFYSNTLLKDYQFDYLVLGSHFFIQNGDYRCSYGEIFDKESLSAYTQHLIKAMRTGFFKFVAHPDLFGNSYLDWDQNCIDASILIIETAVELDIPLEINACGIRKGKMNFSNTIRYQYPLLGFWELAAKYGAKVIVNSDAHTPEDIKDSVGIAYDIVKKFKLNLVELNL